jgi:hypothetical protein
MMKVIKGILFSYLIGLTISTIAQSKGLSTIATLYLTNKKVLGPCECVFVSSNPNIHSNNDLFYSLHDSEYWDYILSRHQQNRDSLIQVEFLKVPLTKVKSISITPIHDDNPLESTLKSKLEMTNEDLLSIYLFKYDGFKIKCQKEGHQQLIYMNKILSVQFEN